MDRFETPKKRHRFAEIGVLGDGDAAVLETSTGHAGEADGLAESGAAAADEISQPIGAHPRSDVTGRHDEGSGANETVDSFSDLDGALRREADVPTGTYDEDDENEVDGDEEEDEDDEDEDDEDDDDDDDEDEHDEDDDDEDEDDETAGRNEDVPVFDRLDTRTKCDRRPPNTGVGGACGLSRLLRRPLPGAALSASGSFLPAFGPHPRMPPSAPEFVCAGRSEPVMS